MPEDIVSIRIRLAQARQFINDTRAAARGVEGIGRSARATATAARAMGGAVTVAGRAANRGMGMTWTGTKRAAGALGLLTAATTRWGLGFNADTRAAQIRLGLFSNDVNGLMRDIGQVDMRSAFDLPALVDATAYLGQAGRNAKGLGRDLQGMANAAAATGKGNEALAQISVALGQIQARGEITAEEVNQLADAGINVRRVLKREFKLTGDQVSDLGNQHIKAKDALDAIITDWTSGKMASAAERQVQRLGGQWDLFVGNARKASGSMTSGLADQLEREVLPAANRAAQAITDIFSRADLTTDEKLRRVRRVIERELGPIADEIGDQIEAAHLDQRLGEALEAAAPIVANAAVDLGKAGVEAFANAWLHSGLDVQIASVFLLAAKTGVLKKGAGALVDQLKGGKGPLGKVAGEALSRGGSPAHPLWVAVVNNNPLTKGDPLGLPDKSKTPKGRASLAQRALDLAKKAAPAAAGAAPTAAGAIAIPGVPFAIAVNDIRNGPPSYPQIPARPGNVTAGGNVPFVHNPFQRVPDTVVTVKLISDGREQARVHARAVAAQNARRR